MSQIERCKELLLLDGWTAIGPYSFRKNEFDVIFDTSSWAELYLRDHHRLADISLSDAESFWASIQSSTSQA